MSDDIDLTGYFERIGFSGSIAPTLETLTTLVELHAAAIPFENLSPLTGEPVRLERLNLQQKLIFDKRGGYCLEQNLLFHWVLETLGYENIDILSARVVLGGDNRRGCRQPHPPRRAVGANTYLADVGFGGRSPTAPIRIRADAEQETPHEVYRLTGGDPEWRLEAKIDGRVARALRLRHDAARSRRVSGHERPRLERRPLPRQPHRRARDEGQAARARQPHLPHAHARRAKPRRRILKSVAEIRDVLSGPFGIALPPADKLDPVLQTLVERELPLLGAA